MTSPKADKDVQDVVEGRAPGQGGKKPPGEKPQDEMPSAGPHADPALTNPEATPGTGYLPPPGEDDAAEAPGGEPSSSVATVRR